MLFVEITKNPLQPVAKPGENPNPAPTTTAVVIAKTDDAKRAAATVSHPEALVDMPPELKNIIAGHLGVDALILAQTSDENLRAVLPTLAQLKNINLVGFDNTGWVLQYDSFIYNYGDQHAAAFGFKPTNPGQPLLPVNLVSYLKLPADDDIAQVVLGGTHSGVLTQKGALFVRGSNKFGQLGLSIGRHFSSLGPVSSTRLPLQADETIVHVVLGYGHSALLTSQGRLLVCGSSEFGQLGLGHNNSCNTWTKVTGLKLEVDDRIAQVVLGGNHSAVLTQKGRFFVCGNNRGGELSLGHYNPCNTWTEIDLAALKLPADCAISDVKELLRLHHRLTQQAQALKPATANSSSYTKLVERLSPHAGTATTLPTTAAATTAAVAPTSRPLPPAAEVARSLQKLTAAATLTPAPPESRDKDLVREANVPRRFIAKNP